MAEDLRNQPAKSQQPKLAQTGDPKPATQSDDQQATIDAMKAQIDKLEAILMATIRSQPAVSPDTIWARQHEKEQAIKDDLDRLAAHFTESCQSRTQWEANKLNQNGKRLFKVSVGWCPEIIMRADDDVMAKAYYDKVCGIRAVKPDLGRPEMTTYNMVDVTNDPEAQKIAAGQWQYKAAA